MNLTPARPVVDSLAMAFEAMCLLRCANLAAPPAPRRLRHHGNALPVRPVEHTSAEFSQLEAAERLAGLLTELGYRAECETRSGGGVRRYEFHRVQVHDEQDTAREQTLVSGWQWGRNRLFGTDPSGVAARPADLRVTLARSAWQAAMLAGGLSRREGALRVSVGDPEMAGILVRGTRLIGVTGELTRRPGCLVVTVANAAVPLLTSPPHLRTAKRGTGPQSLRCR